MTGVWVVFRMDDLKVKILGIYKSEEAARQDIEAMDDDDWDVAFAPFVGWGMTN